jgi:hypothetical protein
LDSEPALKPILENGFEILHMDNWGWVDIRRNAVAIVSPTDQAADGGPDRVGLANPGDVGSNIRSTPPGTQ